MLAATNEIGTDKVIALGVACSAVDFPGDQMNPGCVVVIDLPRRGLDVDVLFADPGVSATLRCAVAALLGR